MSQHIIAPYEATQAQLKSVRKLVGSPLQPFVAKGSREVLLANPNFHICTRLNFR